MRRFDWVLYLAVLGVVLWSLYAQDRHADAPEAPPSVLESDGPMLPPPSPLDEQVLVHVNEPKDGIGTAFVEITGYASILIAKAGITAHLDLVKAKAPKHPAFMLTMSQQERSAALFPSKAGLRFSARLRQRLSASLQATA